MHITVENALSIYPLSEGKLVAGRSGLHRILKSVNVIDAPDADAWVKEGEMLFTTAYVVKDRVDDAIRLMRSLERGGSAGLGIKLGRYWNEMPQQLIEEADKLGLPLIELPYPFTFSDQMNGLFQAELSRSTRVLHEIVDKQKQLMKLALSQAAAGNSFERIAGIIGCPMAVVGGRGHLLYNSTPCSEGELLSDWPWQSCVQRIRRGGLQVLRIPLMYRDGTIGFGMFLPGDCQMPKAEEGVFHQAAEMLAYSLGNMLENGTESFLHNDLNAILTRYLQGGASMEAVLQYAEKAGVRALEADFQCVVCALVGAEESVAMEKLRDVLHELAFHPASRERGGYHLAVGDAILSIYPSRSGNASGELESMLRTCFGRTDAFRYGSHRLMFAMSQTKSSPELLAEAFSECLETVKLGHRLNMNDPVLQFETIQLAHLFQYVPDQSMRNYCRHVLGPLLGSEFGYDHEMLQTLETHVKCDAQIGETARQLFIHRNTAAYRLEKIGDLLGVDFKKANDLLRLKLAFLFMNLMRESAPTTIDRAIQGGKPNEDIQDNGDRHHTGARPGFRSGGLRE